VWGTRLRGVELRAGGIGELSLQPGTKHRSTVVHTTIETVDRALARRDMAFIIQERESLVNTGFAGN
jgi:hypothetical protein